MKLGISLLVIGNALLCSAIVELVRVVDVLLYADALSGTANAKLAQNYFPPITIISLVLLGFSIILLVWGILRVSRIFTSQIVK